LVERGDPWRRARRSQAGPEGTPHIGTGAARPSEVILARLVAPQRPGPERRVGRRPVGDRSATVIRALPRKRKHP